MRHVISTPGAFDWSVLSRWNTTGMDYCASPATGGATARGVRALAEGRAEGTAEPPREV